MRGSFDLMPQLAVAVFLWASPELAHASVQTRFDLICQGNVREANWSTTWDKALPTPSEMHIRVDLQRDAFCIESYCDSFTHSDASLEYHCKAQDGEKFCSYGGPVVSSAGPFISAQDFTFERSTGTFHRVVVGLVGDHGVKSFKSEFTGICVLAPFTGISTMSR